MAPLIIVVDYWCVQSVILRVCKKSVRRVYYASSSTDGCILGYRRHCEDGDSDKTGKGASYRCWEGMSEKLPLLRPLGVSNGDILGDAEAMISTCFSCMMAACRATEADA